MSLKEITLPGHLAEAGLDIRKSVLLVADHLSQADFLELTTKNPHYISIGIAKQSGALKFFFADTVRHSQLSYAIEQEAGSMDRIAFGQIFIGGATKPINRLHLKTRIWVNDQEMKQTLAAFFEHIDPDLLNRTITLDIPEGDYLYYKTDKRLLKKVF